MQSIVSTFIGLLFPHALEFDSDSNTVYFLLYETYSAYATIAIKKLLEVANDILLF